MADDHDTTTTRPAHRIAAALVAPLLAGALVPATARAATFPVTIENCGNELTFDAPPTSVVLGYPTIVNNLVALGVADRVVGTLSGSFAEIPADAPDIDVLSPDYNVSAEVLMSLHPDLLITNSQTQLDGSNGSATLDQLLDVGTQVYILNENCSGTEGAETVDGVYRDVEQLGAIFDVDERAAELLDELHSRVDAAAARSHPDDPPMVAFIQIYDGVLYTLARSNYSVVINGAGLVNEFADIDAAFVPISIERGLQIAADHIFVHYGIGTDPATAVAEVTELLPSVPAVQSGNVTALADWDFQASGVTLIDLIEQVATAIQPER